MSLPHDVRSFSHNYWQDMSRQDWRDRRLHWHCYSWRGDGASLTSDGPRRDMTTDLPPIVTHDWLNKPARCIRLAPLNPDEAVAWLAAEWEPVVGPPISQPSAELQQVRCGRAHYDLRVGNSVTWTVWVNPSTFFHLSVIPTDRNCHA